MLVQFAMYGQGLVATEFLLQCKQMPDDFELWEDIPELEEPNGFTLRFNMTDGYFPRGLIRFLLANTRLLLENRYDHAGVAKEVSFIIEDADIMQKMPLPCIVHTIWPNLLTMLARANVTFYVTMSIDAG